MENTDLKENLENILKEAQKKLQILETQMLLKKIELQNNKKSFFDKINTVRVRLNNKNLKKTGENKIFKFKYYETEDFLPHLNILCKEEKISFYIEFQKDLENTSIWGVLNVVDVEDDTQKVTIKFPFTLDSTKAKNEPMQNIGANITYLERYLLSKFFGITANDILDSDNIKSFDQNIQDIQKQKNEKDPRQIKLEEIKYKLEKESKLPSWNTRKSLFLEALNRQIAVNTEAFYKMQYEDLFKKYQ